MKDSEVKDRWGRENENMAFCDRFPNDSNSSYLPFCSCGNTQCGAEDAPENFAEDAPENFAEDADDIWPIFYDRIGSGFASRRSDRYSKARIFSR